MRKFERFFQNLQQDLKAFLFFIVLFSLFRVIFIYIYSSQIDDFGEVWTSIWYGFRLSLKTAGWITLVSFLFAALPHIFIANWRSHLIRKVWYAIVTTVFTVLFFIKISYYKIFNSSFDLMLINGAHDDVGAIIDTAVKEYQLFLRLSLSFVISALLIFILYKILKTKTYLPHINSKKSLLIFTALSIFLLGLFFVFVRYGGAFNYANSITWESAARLKSNLLNEAILDDAQALYRVRSMYKRSQQAINADISADEIKKQIEVLGGDPSADTIDEAFKKEIKERKLAKPQNVIFILGETYALWPFLREYQELGLVEKGLRFRNSPNSLSTDVMLAQGSGTMPTLNGLLSGLSDVGIYENYEKESFKNSYAMGIGAVMKGLGYKTVFWYGGFDGWQNIKNFVLSQSFDEFHSSSEFENKDGNSWGATDRFLFKKVEEYIKADDRQKVFHFILTTSNHPPYSIDVASEGFDKEKIKNLLPPSIPNDEKTLNELGHIWYADKVMGNFIDDIQDSFADTLFIITGDHSDRFNFAREVDIKTLSAIPCIFYAHDIDKSALVFNKAGAHLQIIPTLAELISDKGDKYSSIFPSLFDDTYGGVFNHKLWANESEIGKLENAPQDIEERARAASMVTIYRVKKGNEI